MAESSSEGAEMSYFDGEYRRVIRNDLPDQAPTLCTYNNITKSVRYGCSARSTALSFSHPFSHTGLKSALTDSQYSG